MEQGETTFSWRLSSKSETLQRIKQTQIMYFKKLNLSKAVIALSLGFMSLDAYSQVNVDTISFSITNPITKPGHKGQKAPAHYVLPTVCYYPSEGNLSFEAETDLCVNYSIYNDDNQTCLEGTAYIRQDNPFIISVASLMPGEYVITIEIGAARFEGVLYIEE